MFPYPEGVRPGPSRSPGESRAWVRGVGLGGLGSGSSFTERGWFCRRSSVLREVHSEQRAEREAAQRPAVPGQGPLLRASAADALTGVPGGSCRSLAECVTDTLPEECWGPQQPGRARFLWPVLAEEEGAP